MNDQLDGDGAVDHGLRPRALGRQRQVFGPRRPGMEPKGTATVTRERATGAVAEIQPWTGSCRPEYLLASQDLGRLDVPPLLFVVVSCFLLLFFPLIFCSAYIFWRRRYYKEKASQRAERIRELQDL